jgi:hypothetical protein
MTGDNRENPSFAGISDADGHVLVVDDDAQIRQLVAKFAIVPAGMMGDRADIIFAAPEEISPFISNR